MTQAPSSTCQPPTVTISTSAAEIASSSTTTTRVLGTTGLSRVGSVITTFALSSGAASPQDGVVEPADGVDIVGRPYNLRRSSCVPIVDRRDPRSASTNGRCLVAQRARGGMVDTPALGAGGRKPMGVRVPPRALGS